MYGLACHPRRPFVVASSSRDSTLRLWSMRGFVEPLLVVLLAGGDVETAGKGKYFGIYFFSLAKVFRILIRPTQILLKKLDRVLIFNNIFKIFFPTHYMAS